MDEKAKKELEIMLQNKNIESTIETFTAMSAKINSFEQMIISQGKAIANLVAKVSALEKDFILLRVSLAGTGPAGD